MSVRVQLDQRHGDIYTNLDFVQGKVILTLPTDATISAITVKLEGESKTRLEGPKSPQDQDRKKTLVEVHKLLYKVETVFPAPELRDTVTHRNAAYTLLRGQYEYPFRFKIPFNGDCVNNSSLIKDLKVGQLSVQFGQEPPHAKFPLPPTLGGYPGEAEIKYYVKATVVRPKFYQENLRNEVPLLFLPIEQLRPAEQEGETYGRRKHQFASYNGQTGRRKSLFRQNSSTNSEEEPLAFQVDARLPNPAIVTCREPLPLRIIVERLNNSTSSLYLSMLQIELIGTTSIRAYDIQRKESGTWLLFSGANMSIPLEHPSNKTNAWLIPSRFWENVPLPPSVSPTFKTCNITRTYELEVRVGLTHGMADGVRPEIIVSPIRLDVEVWSGIRPPPQLLEAVAQREQEAAHRPSRLNSIPNPDAKQNPYTQPQHMSPTSPIRLSSGYASSQNRPASQGNIYSTPQVNPGSSDDLPPSYEDAIAADLAPVDGPRPTNYTPTHTLPAFNPDTKSPAGPGSSTTGVNRRVSERLFASNTPRAPRGALRPSSSSSSRVVSEPADYSRFGGDVVHEEPDDFTNGQSYGYHHDVDATSKQVKRQSLVLIAPYSHRPDTGDTPESRPPLPARKPTEQNIDKERGGEESKAREV